QPLQSQKILAAGKALNISRALAWLNVESAAAGLWGQSDHDQMLENMKPLADYVDIRFTKAPGRTRHNVTLFDTQTGREMHLRAQSQLASRESLKRLAADLRQIVRKESIVVFAGSMPNGPLLDDCLSIIAKVRDTGAKVAVDTSGNALARIVRLKGIWLVKPNIKEFRELLGRHVPNTAPEIAKAARKLSDSVRLILVSRAAKGAIAVTRDKALQAEVTRPLAKVTTTVGCGDYLLAGFLAQMRRGNDLRLALAKAVKLATAKAYGFTEILTWPQADRKIRTRVHLP
ncbi:MAG: 1-phosphofructokinase family hexose kinase, partial [Planctomycetota bacterium]